MEIAHVVEAAPGGVSVLGPSLALDLAWTVHAAASHELRSRYEVLDQLYGRSPDLQRALLAFWSDGMTSLPELQILAFHGGALEQTEYAGVRAALEAALPSVPDDLALSSETPEERSIVLSRLADLSHSRARRRIYFELLADAWAGVDRWWQAEGVPAIGRAAAEARRALERGADWLQLVSAEGELLAPHLPEIATRRLRGEPLLLAPCALFGKGLYLDLPGCMLVGIGASRGAPVARARTEPVARRLRALADPTRLAILDHLSGGPSSVGEIALLFSLAQPTVSAHVKQLREAGVVSTARHGARLELALDRRAVEDLTGELTSLLSL